MIIITIDISLYNQNIQADSVRIGNPKLTYKACEDC